MKVCGIDGHLGLRVCLLNVHKIWAEKDILQIYAILTRCFDIYICQIYFNRRILATICTCEGWVDKNIIMKIKISLEILHSIL